MPKGMTRREREQQLEVDFIGKHYRSEFDEPDDVPAETDAVSPASERGAEPSLGSALTTAEESQVTNGRALAVPTSEKDIEKFSSAFQDDIARIQTHATELRAMPLTRLKAKLAHEYDLEAKAFLDKLEDSHETAIKKFLDRMHKLASSALNRIGQPAKEMRAECQRVQIDWNREAKRREDEDRRKREAAQKAAQEAARAAEIAHLKEQEKPEAAAELAATPLPPVSSPPPKKSTAKIEGVVLIDVLKIDPEDPFDDALKFWSWFAEHPEVWSFVRLEAGSWKDFLTSNRGTITPPGLKIVAATETRTRG